MLRPSMYRPDRHEAGEQEGQADDEAQDVLVVSGKPRSGCCNDKEQSELCRDASVGRGHEEVKHGHS
jgi:hypothetical protein